MVTANLLCMLHAIILAILYWLRSASSFYDLADQFIACGKSRDVAHDLASQIWLAVIDNLDENDNGFLVLKRLAQEDDVSCRPECFFLPFFVSY